MGGLPSSCSSSGTISLYDQLMFVPPASTEYLKVHELSNTRHMNHSARFWQLVEQHCPDFRYHEAVLNDLPQDIPDWFHYSMHK
jgi:predicted metal-dependent hydrolase